MGNLLTHVQWETRRGIPRRVGDLILTPESRSLTVRWRGGGWVWNFPSAVHVERGGLSIRHPIYDLTRIIQWALLGLGAWALLRGLVGGGRRRRLSDG